MVRDVERGSGPDADRDREQPDCKPTATVLAAEVNGGGEGGHEANVSEGTVFNYFPRKEDLFYSQMEAFESALVEAGRNRPTGESVLAAFRSLILSRSAQLAEKDRPEIIRRAARVIADSPALQAREREIVAAATQALADFIAKDTKARADDVVALVAATALMGVQRALQRYVRAEVLAGRSGPELAAAVRSQGKRAFARLERGLGEYAVRRR